VNLSEDQILSLAPYEASKNRVKIWLLHPNGLVKVSMIVQFGANARAAAASLIKLKSTLVILLLNVHVPVVNFPANMALG